MADRKKPPCDHKTWSEIADRIKGEDWRTIQLVSRRALDLHVSLDDTDRFGHTLYRTEVTRSEIFEQAYIELKETRLDKLPKFTHSEFAWFLRGRNRLMEDNAGNIELINKIADTLKILMDESD